MEFFEEALGFRHSSDPVALCHCRCVWVCISFLLSASVSVDYLDYITAEGTGRPSKQVPYGSCD